MNTQSQITEGTKFTIKGRLNGQAGRIFTSRRTGIVKQVKTVMAGTKYETTTITFEISTDGVSIHKGIGGVCEMEKFMENVTINQDAW